MEQKNKHARLIPFKVNSVETTADMIPYGVKTIEAPHIWRSGEKGKGVVVAILDTGIDLNHPDLKDRIIGGRNFTKEGSPDDYLDRNGHGTHVAGIIGASENEKGVVGVAPECSLLIVKVLDGDGSGDYQGITEGIKWATKWRGKNGERVRIMNMSLGGAEDDHNLHEAIKKAVEEDILVVVASGNEGDDNEETFEAGYPACYKECIEVSASDENNRLAPFSNNNEYVDCIASGVNVLSTYIGSQYAKLSGTSMATPHISGALALIVNVGEKYFNRHLCESEVYALLIKNTVPLGFKASSEGHGLVRLGYMAKVRELVNFIDKSFC